MTDGDEGDSQGSNADPEYKLGDGQVALNAEVLQIEVAFHSGEVTFDISAWAHQVTPLADEERICQEAFALTAQVVVDIDRSVEHVADEAQ